MVLCNPQEVESVKQFLNSLLFLVFGVSIGLLVFHGFAAPTLSPFGAFCLRLLAAITGQWFVCRVARSPLCQMLPAIVVSFFAVWGFFLMLTVPSRQHATFGGFLTDYVSPAACCWTVWWLYQKYYK